MEIAQVAAHGKTSQYSGSFPSLEMLSDSYSGLLNDWMLFTGVFGSRQIIN